MSTEQRAAPERGGRKTSGRASVAGRITVGLIPKVYEELERLTAATRLSTTDVVNRAISIYHLIDSKRREGYELVLRQPETGKEVIVEII
ncbi:hypothetical protein [Actinoplanes aureus]|uniref:Uncharacterized protein n=1 Tax=Actinoplanes aureus TaxID=2792083 RepID=A0A931G2U6_9ACTN|nr:hypothetical protein [Actinoplanes aureus]MBG0568545.1 hypothetical protein [Actinoplanes aureus]